MKPVLLCFCLMLAVSCAKTEKLLQVSSPNGALTAVLEGTASGAWDSFAYDVIIQSGDERVGVALFTRPIPRKDGSLFGLAWRNDSVLTIEYAGAERAEVYRPEVTVRGHRVEIVLVQDSS